MTRFVGLVSVGCLVVATGCTSDPTEESGVPADTEGPEEVVVHLDSAALILSDVVMGVASEIRFRTLPATGTIGFDENRVSHIGPKIDGRIIDLIGNVGDRVVRGQVLAHLESPEVGTTRAAFQEAEALLAIAQETFSREQRLEALGVSSRKELLAAEAELRRIEASHGAAAERLRVFGADTHGDGGHFDLVAPYDGTVVERHAGRGEVVEPADQVFTVADLSRLWIGLDIFEQDLRFVRSGLRVDVTTQAWPDRVFSGSIVYVGDILDAERRTVPARVELSNPDGALKPGMFATALIQVQGEAVTVGVPRDAVQDVEGHLIVWVPGEEEGEFHGVEVVLGEELPDGRVEILSGLSVGDAVVVEGAFTLKSEFAEGDFGDSHAH